MEDDIVNGHPVNPIVGDVILIHDSYSESNPLRFHRDENERNVRLGETRDL